MPRPTKSKAVAVIDGRIVIARQQVDSAYNALESAKVAVVILQVTRDQIVKALAVRKKTEKTSRQKSSGDTATSPLPGHPDDSV